MKKRLIIMAILLALSILVLSPLIASADTLASGLSEEAYTFSLDAATVTIFVPEGWDVVTRDSAVGKPAADKYGNNWDDLLVSMKNQKIYLTAINPSTQAQVQLSLNDRGTGTPAPNFYRISQQEADDMSAQFLQAGLPMTVAQIGGAYYMCYAYANSSGGLTFVQYQTRVSSTYISISLSAAENSALSDDELQIIKSIVQNISLQENVLLEMAEGYGYLLVALLWLVFVIFAFARLVNRKKPLLLRQAQAGKLGHIGGAPLVSAIRAILGIAAGIYFFVYNNGSFGLFWALYALCLLLLMAVPLLLLRRSRAFTWIYALGIILTSFLNIGFLSQTWRLLLIFGIDPVVLICLLASKRTAVLFHPKRVRITDAPAEPASASDLAQSLAAAREEAGKDMQTVHLEGDNMQGRS